MKKSIDWFSRKERKFQRRPEVAGGNVRDTEVIKFMKAIIKELKEFNFCSKLKSCETMLLHKNLDYKRKVSSNYQK